MTSSRLSFSSILCSLDEQTFSILSIFYSTCSILSNIDVKTFIIPSIWAFESLLAFSITRLVMGLSIPHRIHPQTWMRILTLLAHLLKNLLCYWLWWNSLGSHFLLLSRLTKKWCSSIVGIRSTFTCLDASENALCTIFMVFYWGDETPLQHTRISNGYQVRSGSKYMFNDKEIRIRAHPSMYTILDFVPSSVLIDASLFTPSCSLYTASSNRRLLKDLEVFYNVQVLGVDSVAVVSEENLS